MIETPLAALQLGLGAWAACAVLGGLIGLDATSFPQAMISRPLVSGTLGGLLFGSPGDGMLVGLGLELLDLRRPPLGAARYPDSGPAALVAGSAYAAAGGDGPLAFAIALLAGWAVSRVGGWTVHVLRLANGRLVGDPETLGTPRGLERRHRLAIWIDGGRALAVTAAFLLPSILAVRLAAGLPAGPSATGVVPFLIVGGLGAAAGAAARGLGAPRGLWPLVLVGAALALAGVGG